MELVVNHSNKRHLDVICELLDEADEAWISTAFLKEAGLKRIIKHVEVVSGTGSIFFVVGRNFGLTEPNALHALRNLFHQTKSKLYLAHAEESNEVFHPKFLLFRKGNSGSILVGSANLTEAGLTTNFECSLLVHVNVDDPIWGDALDHFRVLMSPRVSRPATLLAINHYEAFFDHQRAHNSNARAVPAMSTTQRELNYEGLVRQFAAFDSADREAKQMAKTAHYNEARKVLDQIADDRNLTQNAFAKLLNRLVGEAGETPLWHSGSLYRLRGSVYPHFRQFRKLVKAIREKQEQPIAYIFDEARAIVKSIEGASVNYIAEIMMTYNPIDCANLNNNPLTVLRDAGGIKLKASAYSFTGKDYQEYSNTVKEICEEFELSDMLEADSFFNDIFWKIYKNQKSK